MKAFLLLAQSLGIFVIYLIVVFVLPLPAIKAFEFFNPAHIVDEDDVSTYFSAVNIIQAIIAFIAILIIMGKINV